MSERVRTTTSDNGPSQEDFETCLSEITELKTASQRLAQKIKTALAAYEAKGGDPEEIKFAHKLQKLDKGEAQGRMRRLNRAAVWAGVIEIEPDGQASFAATFGAPVEARKGKTKTSLTLEVTRARSDGYNSGLAGSAIDANPFAGKPGSEQFVVWRDGWEAGHEDYLMTHPDAEGVDTSRERPARKAANGSVEPQVEPEVDQAMSGRRKRGRPPGSRKRAANGGDDAHA